jgi:anhydro-N-acetylmuramic acid kinase
VLRTVQNDVPYRDRPIHLLVGLMSGTSADGIDAVVAEVAGAGAETTARLLGHHHVAYSPEVRAAVLAACEPTAPLPEVARLDVRLGELFAEAALAVMREQGIESVDAIASHGQTVCHLPDRAAGGATVQLGDPAVIAERTGATVVADFRRRDMAAGGEGAPLVPFADFVLFRSRECSRAVQNIGGVANVTVLPAGGTLDDVIAFDTGPGNSVIDGVAAAITGGRMALDEDGTMAASGLPHEGLIAWLMEHPFFRRPPPKSTGREEFGPPFAARLIERGRELGLDDADLAATATALTAASIASAYRNFVAPRHAVAEMILGGGGSLNPTLVRMLGDRLPGVTVRRHEDFGIPAQAKEALAFAILGHETLMGQPANVPTATGARHPVVLGIIVPGRPR